MLFRKEGVRIKLKIVLIFEAEFYKILKYIKTK